MTIQQFSIIFLAAFLIPPTISVAHVSYELLELQEGYLLLLHWLVYRWDRNPLQSGRRRSPNCFLMLALTPGSSAISLLDLTALCNRNDSLQYSSIVSLGRRFQKF